MNIEDKFNKSVLEHKTDMLERFNRLDLLNTKVKRVARKFIESNISEVVVGISGGVDSAVVLAILVEVKKQYMPELKIHGYCITFNDVYGDIFESKYINLLKNKFTSQDVSIDVLDCSKSLNTMMSDLGIPDADSHLLAQSSYALRYQMFFTYAQRHNAVTVGTTNADEFMYVGWFGKNSDMVVDFQIITNWHKFEVIEAAKKLQIPEEIITRVPTGDLLDQTSDEDNFGCTYDELAYFSVIDSYDHDDEFISNKYAKVFKLHNKNLHKYQGQTFNPIFIS